MNLTGAGNNYNFFQTHLRSGSNAAVRRIAKYTIQVPALLYGLSEIVIVPGSIHVMINPVVFLKNGSYTNQMITFCNVNRQNPSAFF